MSPPGGGGGCVEVAKGGSENLFVAGVLGPVAASGVEIKRLGSHVGGGGITKGGGGAHASAGAD